MKRMRSSGNPNNHSSLARLAVGTAGLAEAASKSSFPTTRVVRHSPSSDPWWRVFDNDAHTSEEGIDERK